MEISEENNKINNEKQVSSVQLVMLIFVVGMSTKMFMLPVLMLKVSLRDSYIAMAINLVGELICLAMFVLAMKLSPEKNFYQLLETIFPKIIAKIFIAIIAVYFSLKLLLLISEIKIFFSVSIYESLKWGMFVIPLLLLLATIATKPLRSLARANQIFTPLILISIVIMLILVVNKIDFANLLPILENGFAPCAKSVVSFSMWHGDFSILLLFFGNIKKTKYTHVASMVSGGIAGVITLFFSIMIFATYANVSELLQYGQNISDLTQLTLAAYNFGRFDLVVFAIWMLSVFVKAALLFSCLTSCISYVTTLKNKMWLNIGIGAVLYLIIVVLVDNDTIFTTIATKYLSIASLVLQFLVPIITLLASAVSRHKRRAYVKKYCARGLYDDKE